MAVQDLQGTFYASAHDLSRHKLCNRCEAGRGVNCPGVALHGVAPWSSIATRGAAVGEGALSKRESICQLRAIQTGAQHGRQAHISADCGYRTVS